ncbi:S9 family peptidase [Sphingosinicella rhizophila]|uniref:DPP IV N-terminal domain-containing protein n=1 Tax=Sphingosinicella rhizophila TaxID=3050082 RepID=A0ABU3Q942_9SPHN|nr:DPP IV N-terminal domain-containing protein [Sphingosinicella sp. GR2756]MDT9599924.1 DPP IV N-terminal domain-containing protein [Sphingosinicella sp. GR2756]
MDSLQEAETFDKLLDIASLVKGGRVAANWLPDGRFWYIEGAPTDTRVKIFDPTTKSLSDLFDTKQVREAFRNTIGRDAPYAGLPFNTCQIGPDGSATFSVDGDEYRLKDGRLAKLPKPSMMETHFGVDAKSRATPKMMQRPGIFSDGTPVPEALSPDGARFASLKDGDIHIRSVCDGRYDRLTDDAEPDNGWDVESLRMGISSSGSIMYLSVNPWSPDGGRLYATRWDARRVGSFSRIRYLRHFDEVETIRMTRVGDAMAVVQPYIFDIYSGARVRIELDPTDKFILLLGWSANGDSVYLFEASRDMRDLRVLEANAATGEVRCLFSESGETFIRIQHEVLGGRSGCTILPNGQGFLWESERTGWKHLYHYNLDGKLVRQLTEGDWPVGDVLTVDPAGGIVYFSAGIDQQRPYDIHLCRVTLAGGKVERLTEEAGIHDIQFAPDFSCFVDTVQRPDLPPRSSVRGMDGALWHAFPPADISALDALGWSPPEQVVMKAADGETDLWGVLHKPIDFDPSRKYPVIEYIYGGPQAAMVEHKFLPLAMSKMSGLNHALPALGYLVFVVDARGTPRRSKAFQDAVFGDWRHKVTADHAAALRHLAAQRSYVDLDRVGMWGHSWGGYFTTANMLDNPDLYRAGVASAPGYDPFGLFLYEPYIGGLPSAKTRAAYEAANLFKDAHGLQGALMIVAGMNDLAVFHDAVKMTNTLIEAGKIHEFVPLPNQHHGYGAAHEDYFVRKLVGHFDEHLMAAE